jgi:hypothetical protein
MLKVPWTGFLKRFQGESIYACLVGRPGVRILGLRTRMADERADTGYPDR